MTQTVRAACVIGWPVEHSRSPLIHRYWIARYGIDGDYRKEPVRPKELPAFVAALRARGYAGCNVTIPHKEAVLALTRPDDQAQAIGAANTLWFEDEALRSTNTDVEGFLGNLDAAAPGWDRGLATAVVLGAGGSARAIIYGLLQRGLERVHVVNRTRRRAQALRARFGNAVMPAHWEEIVPLLAGAGLLVNTTSLGMKGEPDLTLDLRPLSSNSVVADLVYAPLETTLLRQARARGLRTADGLGMLLHQAVRGFSLWFGVRPEVTPELRALVEADLR